MSAEPSPQEPSTRLGAGREFDLIRRLAGRWGNAAAGLGDDAAILDVPAGHRLVTSTDTAVEGIHFRREWLTLRELGWRAVVAALSDLAAMAAEPLGILVAITLPDGRWLDELGDGIADAARSTGCRIVGGDLTRGDRLSLTITVLGTVARPLTRAGARPGQQVYVTGRLGGPAAAVLAWLDGREPAPLFRERFVRPVPRLAEARWLAAAGATAAIDVSDGLAAECGHLAAASGVHVAIELDLVPVLDELDRAAAAVSGEEYELVVTAPITLDGAAFEREFGIPITSVGRVTNGGAGTTVRRGGVRVDLPGGYDHFSG